jgi:hypothetical protein
LFARGDALSYRASWLLSAQWHAHCVLDTKVTDEKLSSGGEMNQINVNPVREPTEVVDASGDRSTAAGINLITVLVVLAVLAVIAWYLFTGPFRAGGSTGTSTTNITVNPAPTSATVNPPSQPNIPAPAGNTGNTGTSGNSGSTSGTGGSGASTGASGSSGGGTTGSSGGSATNP